MWPIAALRLLHPPRRLALAEAGRHRPMTTATARQTPLLAVPLPQRLAAEFAGTFALVFAGCGAIVVAANQPGSITHEGIAATFGLVIMAMIYAVGHVSGAHFNP